jgi:hypothetical protein
MSGFLSKLLKLLRERRGMDMPFMCHHLLSDRGEASQTALAQEIINDYLGMNASQRLLFFEMLSHDFAPDQTILLRAACARFQLHDLCPGPEREFDELSSSRVDT